MTDQWDDARRRLAEGEGSIDPDHTLYLRATGDNVVTHAYEPPDSLNRDVVDPEQPGASFWPSTVEEHRVLYAKLEAELKGALETIRALHRCPHCDRPLTAAGEAR